MSMHLTLMGNASRGLPRQGLVALYDPYRDAYGLDATARAALQAGVDYSGRGNTLTYGATTGASTDDPSNTGTAWSFDGGDFLKPAVALPWSTGAGNTLFAVVKIGSGTKSIFGGGTRASIYSYVNTRFTAVSDNGAQYILNTPNGSITTGGTYFVAATCMDVGTGATQSIWIGNTKSTATASATNLSAKTMTILGASYDLSGGWDSLIHLAGGYSRALTDGEITRMYLYVKSLMAGRGVTVA